MVIPLCMSTALEREQVQKRNIWMVSGRVQRRVDYLPATAAATGTRGGGAAWAACLDGNLEVPEGGTSLETCTFLYIE